MTNRPAAPDHTADMTTLPAITAQNWLEALLTVATDIGYDGLKATAPAVPHVVDGQPVTLTARTLAQAGWPTDSIAHLGEHGPHEYTTNLTPAAAESARHMYEAEQAGKPLRTAVMDAIFGVTRFRIWVATPATMEDTTLTVREALVALAHDPIR